MIRPRRRRLFIYIGCFLCILLFNLLTSIENLLYPGDGTLTPDEIGTRNILDAVGLRNTTSASKLLPLEYTVVLEPEVTGCYENGKYVSVLFMVISSPENRQARNSIRQSVKPLLHTYNDARLISDGTNKKNITILFFTGISTDSTIQERLEEEAKYHGDVVVDNMIDTYLLLSLKVLRMFKWVRQKCTQAQYIVKIDDDVHLNLLKFVDFINSLSINKSNAQNLIAGHVYKDMQAVRSKSSPYGKWYIPYEMRENDTLPPFVAGFFYVLGRNAMERIYQASQQFPLFHLEDVYLTGIIASEKLKMNLTDIPYIYPAWGFVNLITSSCEMRTNIFVAHPVTPIQLKCWSQFNQLSFRCSYWPVSTYCFI